MKLLCLLFVFSLSSFAAEIKGIVSVEGKAPQGTLFIFAKGYQSKMPMPMAVLKIQSPKYPYKFTLTEANKMMPSMPFKGPFSITARISPSGNAMDKSGIQASTTKAINIGDSDVKLELKGK